MENHIFPKYEAIDRIFAVIYLAVGYGFIYAFTNYSYNFSFEWALVLFTLAYVAVVLFYLWAKGCVPSQESWFWLGVMLALVLPFPFWSVLYLFQVLALMAAAAYWTLSAAGKLLAGKTSQWVFFDGWNALALVPFGNFFCQMRVLFGGRKTEEAEAKKSTWRAVLLGLLLALPALFIVLPLLSSADAGFEQLTGALVTYIQEHLLGIFVRFLFAVPVSCYLYGLIFGSIYGRNTDSISTERLWKAGQGIKRVPDMAVCTALGVLCMVYVLFMGIQGNYLFSAFTGNIPQGFTYAEYARRGFFELCQLGIWNLILLGCAGMFSRSRSQEHRGLSFFTVLLSVLTLFLIATAMSKMGMYICVYGLTVNRILPMVFMVWLVLVFVSVILRQRKVFPMVRICVMAGAVLFCLLCVFPVEDWARLYNVWARARGLIV